MAGVIAGEEDSEIQATYTDTKKAKAINFVYW